jgi:hypothetical protein
VAVNGAQLGARLVRTVAMSLFPELAVELDLLGSGYNADLLSYEMETLWA